MPPSPSPPWRLGIGANTTIFSVVNAILLRPLPFKDADRIVEIVRNIPGDRVEKWRSERTSNMNLEEFQWWRMRTTTLSHLGCSHACLRDAHEGRTKPSACLEHRCHRALFPLLGVQPDPRTGVRAQRRGARLGQSRDPRLPRVGTPTFRSRSGDRVGRPVTLDRTAYTVVGVMPREVWPSEHLGLPGLCSGPPLALTAERTGRILRTSRHCAAEGWSLGRRRRRRRGTQSREELRGDPPADPRKPRRPGG